MDHACFQTPYGQYIDADNRIHCVDQIDDIPTLLALAADQDLQLTVRSAAQRRARRLASHPRSADCQSAVSPAGSRRFKTSTPTSN